MKFTIFQFFHWYYPKEGHLWRHAAEQAERLSQLGVTHVWLPPAYKSAKGQDEPGYAVYDLYDLGEFDQKGTVPTKYGTRDEYLHCIEAIHNRNMYVLADVVLNHKMGADEQEDLAVKKVNFENRLEAVSEEHMVKAHTRFTFPGRKGKYSDFLWNFQCFTGISEQGEVHLVLNEHTKGTWEEVPETQYGNYDYLMGCDVEFRNPAVREELRKWGKWYLDTTGVDGFRLDAVKHITADFFPEWLRFLKEQQPKDLFCMGEYWKSDVQPLLDYIESTSGTIQLFDVPLHFNFHKASKEGKGFDLRQIFDHTLLKTRPELAITFVDNHDTQPLQSLESWVETWFKPHAYAIILLREAGIPCVFYPALYGSKYQGEKDGAQYDIEIPYTGELELLLQVRNENADGEQYEYWDDANIVGWTRIGDSEKAGSGCAVLLSNGDDGKKQMSMGAGHANKKMIGLFDETPTEIQLNEQGEAEFFAKAGKINVWKFVV